MNINNTVNYERYNSSNQNCPICFTVADCNAIAHDRDSQKMWHPIHKKCMDSWIEFNTRHQQVPTCPVCRASINTESLFNLGQELALDSIIGSCIGSFAIMTPSKIYLELSELVDGSIAGAVNAVGLSILNGVMLGAMGILFKSTLSNNREEVAIGGVVGTALGAVAGATAGLTGEDIALSGILGGAIGGSIGGLVRKFVRIHD
jgi:hypothetical protein